MAVSTVAGNDSLACVLQTLGLTTSYLGASDWILVKNASRFDLWIDDADVAVVVKVSRDGGTTFSGDCALAAGFGVFPIASAKGDELVIDVKTASGTANAGGIAYSGD